MNKIKIINTFAIALPIVILISYPIYKEESFVFSLLSSMITGFVQVILGTLMLAKNSHNKDLQYYIFSVFSFFLIWFINALIGYNTIISFFLFPIPLILAIYLSVLIYKYT